MLDADGLRAIAELAAEADAQVWLERVGAGEEVSVLIEDGAVAEGADFPASTKEILAGVAKGIYPEPPAA